MILRRLGNKSKIADEIQQYFPSHRVYIEPFFGAGGMFFHKPKAKYNIVNDIDSDVFNLFNVVMNQKEELKKAFYLMPFHNDLLRHWKMNQEKNPITKALRFLFLSNFTYLGKQDTLRYSLRTNDKTMFFKYIEYTFDKLYEVKFNNRDFRDFFRCLSFIDTDYGKPSLERENTLIYNDPPYIGTNDNYSNSFTEQDTIDLFEANIKTGCKFVISEFNNPFILDLTKQHNLEVITIGKRRNLKNVKTEIIVVNFDHKHLKTDLFSSGNLVYS